MRRTRDAAGLGGNGTQSTLPPPHSALVPTVNIAKVVGWPASATPTPAPGLKVTQFADGLEHPRWLLVLPNGDVLVAETNAPPKPEDGKGIKGWVMKLLMRKAGAGTPSANRITLLRDTDGDGVAETRSVFLEGLNSPFGMALVGDDLYVANTDAVVRFPYQDGADQDHRARREGRRPAGGTDQSPLDQERDRRARDGTKLYVTVGSNSNVAENGMRGRGRPRRDLGDRPATGAAPRSSPRACAIRTVWPGSRRPARFGPRSTSATRSAAISCPIT